MDGCAGPPSLLSQVPDAPRMTQELRIERTFDCSPSQLWAAWTQPDRFAKWISPFPPDAVVHELDPRPGGKVRFDMIDDEGATFPEEGMFERMDSEKEIVMFQQNAGRTDLLDKHPMRMTARFEREGPRTKMFFTHTGYPDAFPLMDARNGFMACFDQMARVVQQR